MEDENINTGADVEDDTIVDNSSEELTEQTADPLDSGDMSFLDGLDDGSESVHDDAYRAISIPASPDLYEVAASDKGNEYIDDSLLENFRTFSHGENISQGLFAKLVSWSLAANGKYEDETELRAGFKRFCQRERVSRLLAEKIVGFHNQARAEHQRNIEKVQKFAQKSSGRSGDDARASAIARIQQSKAYRTKGLTTGERAAHLKAVKALLTLTQGR